MGNKAEEQTCLDLAIQKCLKQRGVTKKIGQLLSGDDITRADDERPDFLRYTKVADHNRDVIIGIEHFRVDHFSKELANARVGSTGVVYEKNLKKAFEKWKPQISEDSDVPDGAIKSIGELVAQAMEQRILSTYHAFIESFRYSLNKHIQSIEHYHAVLDKHAGNSVKKLAFLIEVHSDFRTLFYHDKNGVHHQDSICPVFEDIVQILETIDHNKVHYVILCFGNTVYNEDVKVIALPTQNIRNQFLRFNVPIYHYAGHDIYLSGFQAPRLDFNATSDYKRRGDSIDFHIAISSKDIKDEKKFEMVLGAFKIIQALKRKKQNYATTDIVEMFCDVWGDFCEGIADKSVEEIMAVWPLINRNNESAIYANYAKHKSTWE